MRTTYFVKFLGGFYFRILGYGLAVEQNMWRSFSERNGYRRVYRIGRWGVEFLTPRDMRN